MSDPQFGDEKGLNMEPLLTKAREMRERRDRQLSEMIAVGRAGRGKIEARVNAHLSLLAIRIHPEMVDPAQGEALEKLVLQAINRAMRRSREARHRMLGPNSDLPRLF